MNIIIFYEHLVREWEATMRLKKTLEEKGHSVSEFSIIFETTKAKRYAKKRKVDFVFLPWCRLREHEGLLADFVKYNRNVKFINLHQEQITSKSGEKSLVPQTEFTKNGVFHLTWGNHFRSVLMENGVKEYLIAVTGSIRNDSAQQPDAKLLAEKREAFAAEYGLDPKKKWILFAENRGWYLQRHIHDKDAGTNKALIQAQESLDATFAEMREFDDHFNQSFEFIYRPHPGTTFDVELPSSVHIIDAYSIYDWIWQCVLFLTCESTSIFEAEMCHKPCAIIHDIHPALDEHQMAGVHSYPTIEHLADIDAELIRGIAEQQNKQPIYLQYLGVIDGKAVNRVADSMTEFERTDIDYSAFNITESAFSTKMRQYIWEKMTLLMCKTGLLEKYHYPYSAYLEKRDIPYAKENCWIYQK